MFGEYPAPKILFDLERDNLLPAILFRSSRKQCDDDVIRIFEHPACQLEAADSRKLRKEVERIVAKYTMEEEIIYDHPHFEPLVTTGVGAHHAGQLLLWRLLLEELMTVSALRIMVATGTVAAGVDFPARTAVITAHSRRGTEGFTMLSASELQQMSGRAGRRGKDTVGFCLVAPSRYSDARVIHEVSKKPPEPLRSAYFAAPSTVLNLLKYRNVDDLRYTVGHSLAAFLDNKHAKELREEAQKDEMTATIHPSLTEIARKKALKRARRKVKDAEELEQKQTLQLEIALNGLTKLGHLDGSGLSEKGYWAAELCTTLVLELAEAIEEGLFWDVPETELVGLLAALSGDPHRSYLAIQKNPIAKEKFAKLQNLCDRVRAAYPSPNNQEVKVVPDAAVTVISWYESETWAEYAALLRLAGVAEGDVARLITQTADHLNQMSRLKDSHPHLAQIAVEARKRLMRPPISDDLGVVG